MARCNKCKKRYKPVDYDLGACSMCGEVLNIGRGGYVEG